MATLGGEDRVATVPNALSVVRLACVPVFLWLLFGAHNRLAAAALLAALGATDWVDGYVARHFDQVSTVGKVLDPVADRALLILGVAAIAIDGSVPIWVAVAALGRELIISVGTLIVAVGGHRRIDVQWLGKAGTFGLMVAFPLFLVSHADVSWATEARVAAWVCAVPGLVFGWWSVAAYIPLARRALADARVGEAT